MSDTLSAFRAALAGIEASSSGFSPARVIFCDAAGTNSGVSYTTFAAAYAAAVALTPTESNPVLILGGKCNQASHLGDLNLGSTGWNSSVRLRGLGSTLTRFGTITTTDGTAFILRASSCQIHQITGNAANGASAGANGSTAANLNVYGDDLEIQNITLNGGDGVTGANGADGTDVDRGGDGGNGGTGGSGGSVELYGVVLKENCSCIGGMGSEGGTGGADNGAGGGVNGSQSNGGNGGAVLLCHAVILGTASLSGGYGAIGGAYGTPTTYQGGGMVACDTTIDPQPTKFRYQGIEYTFL